MLLLSMHHNSLYILNSPLYLLSLPPEYAGFVDNVNSTLTELQPTDLDAYSVPVEGSLWSIQIYRPRCFRIVPKYLAKVFIDCCTTRFNGPSQDN